MPNSVRDDILVEHCRSKALQGKDLRCCRHMDQLLRRHEQQISRWCLQVLHDRDDAADCTQDVLIRICKGLPNFRGHCSFATWIYSVTRSACLDHIERRQMTRERETSLPETAPELPGADERPVVEMANREARVLFQALFEGIITERESEAMILHHVDGLSVNAVTDRLGLVNKSGARAFLASAKRKLRNHLPVDKLRQIGYPVTEAMGPASRGVATTAPPAVGGAGMGRASHGS